MLKCSMKHISQQLLIFKLSLVTLLWFSQHAWEISSKLYQISQLPSMFGSYFFQINLISTYSHHYQKYKENLKSFPPLAQCTIFGEFSTTLFVTLYSACGWYYFMVLSPNRQKSLNFSPKFGLIDNSSQITCNSFFPAKNEK